METTTLIFFALLALVFGPIFFGFVNGIAGRANSVVETQVASKSFVNDADDFWNPLDARINGLQE